MKEACSFSVSNICLEVGSFLVVTWVLVCQLFHLIFFSCGIYRVSQEERTKLQESVPYVKLYRYNPKHLYPKLNGYGDNGQRKVWTSCISAYCMSTAV